MDKKTALLELVSEIFQKDVQDIGRDFLLRTRRMEGSVGSGILDAAIRRRLGIVCPGVYGARTYGDLEDAVLGDAGIELLADPCNRWRTAVQRLHGPLPAGA